MGHLGTTKNAVFQALAERLNRNPVGAPPGETLMRILHIMYTEPEAAIGSQFPAGFVTIDKLSRLTGLSADTLRGYLDGMAAKGLVMDIPRKDRVLYALSPLVIGFFEYTFMRVTDKLPLSELADLFEQYHQQPGVAQEFFGADTKLFQTWAYESAMPGGLTTEVLDYEKASAMIRDAGKGSLTMCYCRHQARHRGTACAAPVEDVCTSLGVAAEWLISRGFARPASADELLRVLETTEKLGLVHLADNVQNNPAFLCHCCGCCCGALRTINEHGIAAVRPSNFISTVDVDKCSGCGLCTASCHIHALSLSAGETAKKAMSDSQRCLGCGACVRACPRHAITLVHRETVHVPPKDKTEQMLQIARERGKI
ncbi:MAG: 4Fe-4S dicluster domain-containing protein [Negativicutes bacterium]|nr:4Fe-4S dicluster domain-containing protein [Negativicutes bacterium]